MSAISEGAFAIAGFIVGAVVGAVAMPTLESNEEHHIAKVKAAQEACREIVLFSHSLDVNDIAPCVGAWLLKDTKLGNKQELGE